MVAQVRRFNRTVTQRVGALDDHYLARGPAPRRGQGAVGDRRAGLRRPHAARRDSTSTPATSAGCCDPSSGPASSRLMPSDADRRVRTARLTAAGAGRAGRARPAQRRPGPVPARARSTSHSGSGSSPRWARSSGCSRRRWSRSTSSTRPAPRPALPATSTSPSSTAASTPASTRRRSLLADPDDCARPPALFVVAPLRGEPVGCGALQVPRRRAGRAQAHVGRPRRPAASASVDACWPSWRPRRGAGAAARPARHEPRRSPRRSPCTAPRATARSTRSTTSRTPTTGSRSTWSADSTPHDRRVGLTPITTCGVDPRPIGAVPEVPADVSGPSGTVGSWRVCRSRWHSSQPRSGSRVPYASMSVARRCSPPPTGRPTATSPCPTPSTPGSASPAGPRASPR